MINKFPYMQLNCLVSTVKMLYMFRAEANEGEKTRMFGSQSLKH